MAILILPLVWKPPSAAAQYDTKFLPSIFILRTLFVYVFNQELFWSQKYFTEKRTKEFIGILNRYIQFIKLWKENNFYVLIMYTSYCHKDYIYLHSFQIRYKNLLFLSVRQYSFRKRVDVIKTMSFQYTKASLILFDPLSYVKSISGKEKRNLLLKYYCLENFITKRSR